MKGQHLSAHISILHADTYSEGHVCTSNPSHSVLVLWQWRRGGAGWCCSPPPPKKNSSAEAPSSSGRYAGLVYIYNEAQMKHRRSSVWLKRGAEEENRLFTHIIVTLSNRFWKQSRAIFHCFWYIFTFKCSFSCLQNLKSFCYPEKTDRKEIFHQIFCCFLK